MKSTLGGATTVHLGAHFEWTGSTSTMKTYYSAGGARVALRTGASTLSFILTDHFGSTSVTADSSGALLTDNRYKAWGESRYASGTLPTKFTYTGSPLGQGVPRGQYSNVADFGLMYYGARWYDSSHCLWISVVQLAGWVPPFPNPPRVRTPPPILPEISPQNSPHKTLVPTDFYAILRTNVLALLSLRLVPRTLPKK